MQQEQQRKPYDGQSKHEQSFHHLGMHMFRDMCCIESLNGNHCPPYLGEFGNIGMIDVKQIWTMTRTTMDRVPQRDHQLDYIKGSCVLVMMLYHVMSMATIYYDVNPILRRLSFIHASFLFISGWLVGSYYAVKVADGQAKAIYRRLFVRGLKLCGLFLAINIAMYISGIGYSFSKLGEIGSVSKIMQILFLRSRGSLMAGEILWEIGLFLAVIAPLIALQRIWILYPIVAALWFAGHWGVIPFFMSIGTLGIIAGWHLRNKDYGKALRNKFVCVAFIGVWLLYLIYVLPVKQIGVLIPQLSIAIWMVEIVLWFAVFIILFQSKILHFLDKYFIFWGRYTLMAYCSQLVIARVITTIFHPENFILYFCVALVLNILAMHCVLCSIDLIRRKNWIVNSGYKLVFA